jgi:hypothetical protein
MGEKNVCIPFRLHLTQQEVMEKHEGRSEYGVTAIALSNFGPSTLYFSTMKNTKFFSL